jgi:hypothetical protein
MANETPKTDAQLSRERHARFEAAVQKTNPNYKLPVNPGMGGPPAGYRSEAGRRSMEQHLAHLAAKDAAAAKAGNK